MISKSKQIISLFNSKLPPQAISQALSIDLKTVNNIIDLYSDTITISNAAKLTNRSNQTVYDWINKGKIKVFNIDPIRVNKSDIELLLYKLDYL